MKTFAMMIALLLMGLATPAAVAQVMVAAPGRPAPVAIEWTDEWFDADTYPSLKSAALNLGARWARDASQHVDGQVKTIEVHTKHNIPIAVAHEVRTGIASGFHGVEVRVAGNECAKSATVHCVSLQLESRDDNSRMGNRKAGRLTVQSPQVTVAAAYVEKPWVEDFTGFVNQRPSQNWLIARSPDPCLSESEASSKAVAQATNHVFMLVRARLRQGRWGDYTDARLRELIQHQLVTNKQLVPDKFLQRAQRHYGGVFRQAILVDLSRPNLDHLIALSRQEVVERKASFVATLVSAGALFLVVYLLYLFVNSMTRGYFVWSLRMVAVTVLVVGVVVLLLLG